jgi:hypothetical protein
VAKGQRSTKTSTKKVSPQDSKSQPANPTKDQVVGYGRPPLHGQFKKGQSGNPRGRRKNSRNLKTIIQQALTGLISIREGEKRRSVTKIEGVVLRQIEGALKGNDRAALATLKIAAQVGLLDEAGTGFEEQALTAVERELLQEVLDKVEAARSDRRVKDES